MIDPLDIAKLREVAEDAGRVDIVANMEDETFAQRASKVMKRLKTYQDTFDPPTVLRLLDALEAARANKVARDDNHQRHLQAIKKLREERDEARQEVERLRGLLGDDRAHPTEWR